RFRHFVRLAEADADAAVAIADDDEGAEAEAAAALDDLGDAVDVDDLFGQFIAAVAVSVPAIARAAVAPIRTVASHLEPQSSFAGGIGESLHAAVILEPATIEDDERNAVGLGPFGNRLADDRGPFALAL